MERNHLWHAAFATNLGLLERNLPGLTDDLARRRPAEGVAAPGWLLGHVLGARNLILGLAGRPQPADSSLACYGRGSSGGECAHGLEELVVRLRGTTGELERAFRDVADWNRPVMNPGLRQEQPLEQVVAFLFMHESYHLGQLGLARKLLGLPGAI